MGQGREAVKTMGELEGGEAPLLAWMHPDDARRWMSENKPRGLVDKTMTLREAVSKYTRDGDYFALWASLGPTWGGGGFSRGL